MRDVYWGESPDTETVTTLLENNKLSYTRREDVERYTAERIADGDLVGWMQGRQEMGPRALGNRSILADPRTATSRDRVNRYVKNREEWRPFAPSILAEAASDYLVDDEASPYMIQTFDTVPERREDLAAVVHPGDTTTRPQTVTEEQNPRYHGLISEFENITGVPAVLNTSFNDHGEPIVTTPKEAVRDFYGMGLDVLVIEDIIVEK
nr:carbamoyltransferase C-terminal domain-containing protein [Halapricum sp. CBA1109]